MVFCLVAFFSYVFYIAIGWRRVRAVIGIVVISFFFLSFPFFFVIVCRGI